MELTDEQLHNKGQEAEAFLKLLDEGSQYFKGVLAEIQQEINDSIIGLKPSQKDEFSYLKSQLDSLYEPLKRIRQDILVGQQAWNRMNGIETKNEGIL
jgi:hypothetical protein